MGKKLSVIIMNKTISILFLILISRAFSFSAITEREAVIYALSHNSDILLSNSNASYDSISLLAAKSGWLPELSLESNLPLKSDLESNTTGQLEASAGINQNVPGGGAIKSSYTYNILGKPSGGADQRSGTFEVSFNQPLINGVGRYSDLNYDISIKSLENRQVSLEAKKSILSTLSDIRNLYWNYFALISKSATFEQEVSRTSDLLEIAKSSFAIGEASALDTLSACYDYTSARQNLLDSRISEHQARNDLALALSVPPESLETKDTLNQEIPDLPAPATLITLTRQYDPQLKIFEQISQQLLVTKKKTFNSMLPSLNAQASLNFDRSFYSTYSQTFPPVENYESLTKNGVVSLIFSYTFPQRKNAYSRKQTGLKMQDNITSQKKYEEELTVKLNELAESWNQEKQRIELAKKGKQIAELQYICAEKEYKLGTIERIALTDAQNKLVESEIKLTEMLVEMKKLEIILDQITGTLFQRFSLSVN